MSETQLTLRTEAFELAGAVATVIRLEREKADFNSAINSRIKLAKQAMVKLSDEVEKQREQVS